jgi:hypothetical protein
MRKAKLVLIAARVSLPQLSGQILSNIESLIDDGRKLTCDALLLLERRLSLPTLASLKISRPLEISKSLRVLSIVFASLIIDAINQRTECLGLSVQDLGAETACFEFLPRTLGALLFSFAALEFDS